MEQEKQWTTHLRPLGDGPRGARSGHTDLDVPGNTHVGTVAAVNLFAIDFAPVRTLPYAWTASHVAVRPLARLPRRTGFEAALLLQRLGFDGVALFVGLGHVFRVDASGFPIRMEKLGFKKSDR